MGNPRAGLPTMPDGVAAQHTHLSDGIGRLRAELANGANWESVAALLDGLQADIRAHFAEEEAAMESSGYPEFEAHRQEHAAFSARIQALRARCDDRQTELMSVLAELLHTWFTRHESTSDRRAAEYLKVEW